MKFYKFDDVCAPLKKMKFFRRFSSLKELGFKPLEPSTFPPLEKTMLKDAYAARLHAHGTF
jgi:hypothetical protein